MFSLGAPVIIQGMPDLSQQLGISSFGITKATCKRTQQLPTLLGAVASVLVVVYKRMQQLPAMLGATMHRVKDKTHKTLESVCNARTWPQQCWESCATDQTLLRYASAITERRKCWQLLTQKFDKFQILRNNFQQHTTTCSRQLCKRTEHVTSNSVGSCWPTKLRPFAQGFK